MIRFLLLALGVLTVYVSCGLGLLAWLHRGIPCKGVARIALCAVLGMAVLGWTAAWVFYLEVSPSWTIWSALALSIFSLGISFSRQRFSLRDLKVFWIECCGDVDAMVGGIFALAILFSAGYEKGLVQPFRMGIDQAGYAITAQYLADGGTRSRIENAVLRETQQPTLEYALNAHLTSLSFTTNVASEYLCMAQRFGYPMLVAADSRVLRFDPVADYQFCLLAVPLFCAFLLVIWFCRDLVFLPDGVSKLIALAFLLNCNHLNVLFEGQHAQIAIAPFIVLFYGLLFVWRSDASVATSGLGNWRVLALLAAISAGIFLLYSEALIALGMLGAVLFLWDIASFDTRSAVALAVFGAAVVTGWVCCGLYFVNWCGFIVNQMRTVGGGAGGYWQPRWAFPAEILGYDSIYENVRPFWREIPNLIPRDPSIIPWLIVLSGAVMLVFFSSRFWRNRREMKFWMAPTIVCAGIFFYARYGIETINYSYTKTFVFMLSLLVIGHLASLHRWAAQLAGVAGAFILVVVAVCFPVYVGVASGRQFAKDSRCLPADVRDLRELHARIDLGRYAICTETAFSLDSAMVGAYVPFNWLNLSWADKRLAPNLGKEVVILVVREDNPRFEEYVRRGNLLFLGPNLALLRTGRTVASLGLPESTVVADRPTPFIIWPHAQAAPLKQFVDQFLAGICSRPLTHQG